jgi:hypothetical protein
MDKRDYYLYSRVKIGIFNRHFKKIEDLNGLLADMISSSRFNPLIINKISLFVKGGFLSEINPNLILRRRSIKKSDNGRAITASALFFSSGHTL